MISRTGLSIVFCAVLVASLGLKLSRDTEDVSRAASKISVEVRDFLQRNGLEVSDSSDDLAPVIGRAGACKVVITEVAPQGWQRFAIARTAMGDKLTYTFAGALYSEQPVARTRAYYYWRRLRRYIGLEALESPVLAVVATPDCRHLPLQELATLTARV